MTTCKYILLSEAIMELRNLKFALAVDTRQIRVVTTIVTIVRAALVTLILDITSHFINMVPGFKGNSETKDNLVKQIRGMPAVAQVMAGLLATSTEVATDIRVPSSMAKAA